MRADCAVLHRVVLHRVVLHRVVLHRAVLQRMIPYRPSRSMAVESDAIIALNPLTPDPLLKVDVTHVISLHHHDKSSGWSSN
jgi:hypothetical protein